MLGIGALILFSFVASNFAQKDVYIKRKMPLALLYCHDENTIAFSYHDDPNKMIYTRCYNDKCDNEKKICMSDDSEQTVFDEEARQEDTKLQCPASSAVLPDVTDCNSFYICTNHKPVKYTCHGGYNWNSMKKKCIQGGSCENFQCKGKHGVFASHVSEERLFALCIYGVSASINMCPPSHFFNVVSQECEFLCPGVGTFPLVGLPDEQGRRRFDSWKAEDGTLKRYYICSHQLGRIVKTEQVCKKNKTYYSTRNGCSKKSLSNVNY